MSRPHNITAQILDKRGRRLSIGKNSYYKTHTLQAKHAQLAGMPGRIFLHAEIDAIVRCRNLESAHTIIIDRRDKHGKPLLAKPCPVCMSAISETPIRNIEYTV